MDDRETAAPSLFAALLAGLLLNLLLARQTGYGAREGWLAAPLSVAVLAAAGWMFARCWQRGQNALLRALFTALLAMSSVIELLRLWQLAGTLYPGAVTLTAVCVTVLLPVIYLRRVSAIAQTANVLLCLLAGATAVMLLSVAGRLRVTNLQAVPLGAVGFGKALWAQWTLYPELLLPALWPRRAGRGGRVPLRLAAGVTLAGAGLHTVLELFFGAAMPQRQNPLHTAAQSGALSIFNRLEWLQLLLWTMLVSLKLAVYLYAMVGLCGGKSRGEDTAVGLDRYPLYFAAMLLACVLLRGADTGRLLLWRSAGCWVLAGLVGIGGGLKCLLGKGAA